MGLLREIREMQDLFYGQVTASESLGFSSSRFSAAAVDEINSDVTGVKLIDCLIRCLHQTGLTSLSLKPLRGRVEIAARKNGVTQVIGSLDIRHYADVLATVRNTAGVSVDDGISTAGIICPAHRGEGMQARVELMRAGVWEYVTFKPLVGSPFPGRLADLDVPDATREILRNLAASPAGLVIMAAADDEARVRLMDMLAQECAGQGRDIVLIGKGFAFSGGRFPVVPVDRGSYGMGGWITAALAHEPDVIAVEALADAEAFRSAIDAVQAGKLLLGGMRVDGVHGLLERLCSLQTRHPALPAALIGAVAARHTPVLCRACKVEVDAAGQELQLLRGLLPPVMFRPQGCPACGFTGYADKRVLVEAVAYDDHEARLFDDPPGGDKIDRFLKNRISHGIADEAAAMLRAGDITADMFMAMTRGKGDQSWPE
jgi:type II secretory ATPase GspE/PulE/Tfp pilus assembly ATPase PilB-like protein